MKIKLALAQMAPKLGDKEKNLKKMDKLIAEAARKEAQLIIFPELILTGYSLRNQYYSLAENIPGASIKKIEESAKKNNTHVIFGMVEEAEEGILYNTSVMVGPKGYIGKYRKKYLPTHLVFEEKRYFRTGYQTQVLETEIGKIGLMICYDIFFPEVARLLTVMGSQLIVCISASPGTRRGYFETFISSRAMENTVFLAYVNLVGVEDGLVFWGGSRIVAPDGTIIAKAKYDEEDLITGTIDYSDLKSSRIAAPVLRDLRPELYEELFQLSKK
ncbi:MAG: carbon-nitrogen hydrolase family protein [Candidatus Jordarchaeum sp.]|uniref:carbon-nitrogen hydrolase family protein n=1 Tax=Candidatus Jordarchaeum sp. TaxID=2823881 RepID=UPI00404B016B